LKTVFKIYGVLLTLAFFFSACTVQKSRREMSFLEKAFINTNARYNGYFNAKELMKASTFALEQQHRDNYNQVLPIYKYIAADNPTAVAPDLDLATKKVSIVVNLYRRSKWIDDCYLLVGQAQFLKKDYESAESTLRYLAGEFNPNAPAPKKSRTASSGSPSKDSSKPTLSAKQKQKLSKQKAKERKKYNRQIQTSRKKAAKAKAKGKTATPATTREALKAELEAKAAEKAAEEAAKKAKKDAKDAKKEASGKGKHRPAFQESELWLAKTLIERDNFDGGLRILERLLENPKTYTEIRREAATVQAYAFLQRKNYERALPYLEDAIAATDDKKVRIRLTYIAGQLHQRAGRSTQAVAAFENVLKNTADYEMAFNARLNIALGNAAASGSPDLARESLEKMLKDIKNLEYKDQIYFALAEIALRSGDREEGIKNLELALQYSTSNTAQKAETYYSLAELYFEDESFVKAKNYYDSTLTAMAETDERYANVKRLADNLTEVAKNLSVILEQDSLLMLSALSPQERAEKAAQIKANRGAAQSRAAEATAQAQPDNKFQKGNMQDAAIRTPGTTTAAATTSSFFAYNDRELKQGQRDFERKWGTRPLEDNWRRADKGIGGELLSDNLTDTAVPETTDAANSPISEAEIKELIGNYPSSEEEIAQTQIKIKEAMFNLGNLYRDRLQRLDKSAEILERLNERFPASTFELESWYLLHLVFTDLNNPTKAKIYADKIIEKYPTSVFGKVLQDPSYIKELTDERRRLNAYYDQAYANFQKGAYQLAYEQCLAAKDKFGAKNPLQAKFDLLSAMCIGNLQGKNFYIAGLNEVMAKYPNSPEQTRAREMLRLLTGASAALPGANQGNNSDGPLYLLEEQDLHYIIIVLDKAAKIDQVRLQVSDYSQKYHDLDKLRIANVFLGLSNDQPILVLRRFKDKAEALRFINGTKKNSSEFITGNENGFTIMAISQNNYRNLLKDKRTEVYQEFFNANYQK
jgi:tetratricopeptide (TPR) repeat protein